MNNIQLNATANIIHSNKKLNHSLTLNNIMNNNVFPNIYPKNIANNPILIKPPKQVMNQNFDSDKQKNV